MFEDIETDAVISLDEDAQLITDEVGHILPHFTLVKETLIEIGCVVTSLVGWLSRTYTVAKRCILGL